MFASISAKRKIELLQKKEKKSSFAVCEPLKTSCERIVKMHLTSRVRHANFSLSYEHKNLLKFHFWRADEKLGRKKKPKLLGLSQSYSHFSRSSY